MDFVYTLLPIVHFIGLALGIGAATAKVSLVIKGRRDPSLIPAYIKVRTAMTRLIVIGLILASLSGVTWLVLGYPFTTLLIVKIVLVAAIFVTGPIIDNVVEPKFVKFAPAAGEAATNEFVVAQKQYLIVEVFATLLFYAILILWLLR